LTNIDKLLLGDETNSNLSVGVDGKSVHATTTGVYRVTVREAWLRVNIALSELAILVNPFGIMKIQRYQFFWS
jgi:hypothetical protein